MVTEPLPPALRSRLHLQGAESPGVVPPTCTAPLELLGTTYTMAQEVTWLDDKHFAVGRWDGSLGIFAFAESATSGPVINCAVNSPAQEGVQMITSLDERSFVSSSDDGTIAVWSTASPTPWTDTRVCTLLQYDASFGAANSGALVQVPSDIRYFVAGHANGFVTIWRERDGHSNWDLVSSVDIRAPKPVNPWGLHNIRGIDVVSSGQGIQSVVAGSEDGNLTLLEVPTGKIMSKTCYNPLARRGINSLAMDGTTLLVANCAVGSADRNLWAYTVDVASAQITLTDAVNLVIESNAPQAFNFDVAWGVRTTSGGAFFSSTEEGVLWVGNASASGKLSVLGNVPVTRAVGQGHILNLGSAVCVSRNRLIVASYDVSEFRVTAR